MHYVQASGGTTHNEGQADQSSPVIEQGYSLSHPRAVLAHLVRQ